MTHPGTATSNTITSCILHLYSTQQFIKVNSANRAKIKAYQQRVLTLEARVPLAAETVLCMIYSTCDLWQYTRAEKWQQTKFISHATAILHCRKTIEIVIKFLEAIPQICALQRMSSKLPSQNGGHFERRAAIGRRNTPHHSYIAQK